MAKVKFTTNLEEETIKLIKIKAVENKTTPAKIIEKLILEYINNSNKDV
jgi:hypothetical protein